MQHEQATSQRVDLVLLCGDIQAIRNEADLASLAVPNKFKRLGDFHRYYSGEKTAPILTLVIGGNHEASNYLWELYVTELLTGSYYGGWLAPNIYYMGAAGCVNVEDITIAAASGIYKQRDYSRGRYERQPYSPDDLRSVYHTRQFDITKLGLLNRPDIFMSHDWPNGIEQFGDVESLIRCKPFFREEIQTSTLGSPPLQTLLHDLKPRYWFSAHLHIRFPATVVHGATPRKTSIPESNPEAISLGDDDDESLCPSQTTEFLALSKCTSRKEYLHVRIHAVLTQYFDIPSSADGSLREQTEQRPALALEFNKDWLAITRATHKYFTLQRRQTPMPSPRDPVLLASVKQERDAIDVKAHEMGPQFFRIRHMQSFLRTAPTQNEVKFLPASGYIFSNPQTEAFCQLTGIPNLINTRIPCPPQIKNTNTNASEEIARIRAMAHERKRKRRTGS